MAQAKKQVIRRRRERKNIENCLLYTSDAADEVLMV